MKIEQLVAGLCLVGTVVATWFLPVGTFHWAAVVALTACNIVTMWNGVQWVMEALFGDEGLVLDFGRWLELRDVREARAKSPRERRFRSTNPSARLVRRGAERRVRNTRPYAAR